MKKTFDQLLQEIWEAHNVPDLSNEIKVAVLQLLAPDFVSEVQELFQDYDDTIADELELKLNSLFCIDDKACETYDRSFDFDEWVSTAEGPPSPNQLIRTPEERDLFQTYLDDEEE